MRGFGAGDAARVSGVGYRTLDYWSRSGFLEATISEAAGKGTRRVYGFVDVVALRVARELRHFGVSLQALRKIQARLRAYRHLEHPLAAHRLVVIPGKRVDVARVEIATDGARLESLLHSPGQHIAAAVVMNLADVVGDVNARLVRLDRERAVRRARRKKTPTQAARAAAALHMKRSSKGQKTGAA